MAMLVGGGYSGELSGMMFSAGMGRPAVRPVPYHVSASSGFMSASSNFMSASSRFMSASSGPLRPKGPPDWRFRWDDEPPREPHCFPDWNELPQKLLSSSGAMLNIAGNEDLLEYEQLVDKRYAKVVLVKRLVCVTAEQLPKLTKPAFMEQNAFSAWCFALAEGTHSGSGPHRMWFVAVYHEPQHCMQVERAFEFVGNDIADYEIVTVDEDTKYDEEVYLQYMHAMGSVACIMNDTEFHVVEGTGLLDREGKVVLDTAIGPKSGIESNGHTPTISDPSQSDQNSLAAME